MEKRNYNNMYKSKTLKEINKEVATAPVEEPADSVSKAPIEKMEVKEPVVEKKEVQEEKKPAKTLEGVVTGGLSLNVRKSPNGEIIKSIPNNSRVSIIDESNSDWYEISEPVKGFVMKKFISI